MLRDMTIGQFYPAESVIHRLDPRVKVVGVLAYLISLFLFRGFVGYAVVTVFLGTVIVLSKVPLRYICLLYTSCHCIEDCQREGLQTSTAKILLELV